MAFCMMFRSSRVSTRSLRIISHDLNPNGRCVCVGLRVPDHTSVLDTDLVVRPVDIPHLADTLVQRFLCPEDGSISLHRLLHVAPDAGGR